MILFTDFFSFAFFLKMRIKLLPYFLLQRCSADTPLDLDGIDEVIYTEGFVKKSQNHEIYTALLN